MKTVKTEKDSENIKNEVVDAKSPENDARSTLVEGFESFTCLGPSCLLLSAFSLLGTGDLLLNGNSFLINSVTISDWRYGRDRSEEGREELQNIRHYLSSVNLLVKAVCL